MSLKDVIILIVYNIAPAYMSDMLYTHQDNLIPMLLEIPMIHAINCMYQSLG